MATGYYDANGIWQYGESDPIALFSDLLNLGQASNSAAVSSDRARISFLEQSVEQASTFVASSQAARDSYWGVPANATARLALQNKGARTVRTDLGVTQQYFAATTDGGSNPGGKITAGWYVVNNMGQQMIAPTVTPVTGTASATSEGAITFAGCSQIYVTSVFTTQFRNYTIKFYSDGTSANALVLFRWTNSGTAATTGYFNAGVRATAGGTVTSYQGGSSVSEIVFAHTENSYNGGRINATLEAHSPFETEATLITNAVSVYPSTGFNLYHTGSVHGGGYNGFMIGVTTGTFGGKIEVYGWN